jgi:DNA-binding IclR family transcriptional regulator
MRSDDAKRLYSPTMRIVALAGQVVEHAQLTGLAPPFVQRLHQELGGAAHLVVPSHRSALCLVHCANGEPVPRPHLRELVPSHCTATGKALLAWRTTWSDEVLRGPLEAHTPRTLTDPTALRFEVERVRARGYAVEEEEFEPGVRAVAAPVFAADGEAVAAIGGTLREGERAEEAAPAVLEAAAALTKALA